MLKENPQKRPNIYEVVREACQMQGKEVPIRDVGFHPPARQALADLSRSTPTALCPKHESIKSYLPHLKRLLQSVLRFRLPFKKRRLSQKSHPCEEDDQESPNHLHTTPPRRVHRPFAPERRAQPVTHSPLWTEDGRLQTSFPTDFQPWISLTFYMRRETNSTLSQQ